MVRRASPAVVFVLVLALLVPLVVAALSEEAEETFFLSSVVQVGVREALSSFLLVICISRVLR